MVSDIKAWLVYWRKTLADVDRKRIDVTGNSLPVVSYFIEQVPAKHAKYLWNTSKTNTDTQYININISPCSVQTEFEHGKSKEVGNEIHYPFWIPAVMYKNGDLAPQRKGDNTQEPFFVRDYLNPNVKDEHSIASVREVDNALQKIDFKSDTWDVYWERCETFFKLISGKNFDEFNIKHEKTIVIQKGELRDLTKNILKLYDSLEKNCPKESLLKNLIEPKRAQQTTIPDKAAIVRNRTHLGQMSNEFPLSVSQRESIVCFGILKESNILAVNGPPGTGKTTLLQSIVANSVVSTVVNQQKPELIVACSTNNQAITNILDSFALDSTDAITQRWLPELSSLGLYLSSNPNTRYQTSSSSSGDGFLNDFENEVIEEKEEFFLKNFKINIGESNDLQYCKEKLLQIVQTKVEQIKQHIEIAESYECIELLLKNAGVIGHDDLKKRVLSIQEDITIHKNIIKQAIDAEGSLSRAKKEQPLLQKVFYFLPTSRKHRSSLFHRILLNINFEEVSDYSNYNALIHLLNEIIISNTKSVILLKEKLGSLQVLKNKIEELTSNYRACIDEWNSNYEEVLKNLHTKTGKEYKGLNALEDMHVRLDMSYRYEAFWYAIHFREAEYLLSLSVKKERMYKNGERGKKSYKEKLQRFAGITPIYISTFHSLPRYSTFYDRSEGEQAYYDLFDLLIVDEAGQVAPDIAIPSFALAKKAIIVGDVFQIEPVWSVEEKLDVVNLKMNGLLLENASTDLVDRYIDAGLLSSSGNLMKLAQQACFVKDGNVGGTLLKEHRRCPDKIISFSNKNVYQNKLVLTKGNKRKTKTDLPLKGFIHIDSTSEKIGNSRRNSMDARTIANWINNKKNELEKSFGEKPIKEILAVVSPYKSQAPLIKSELIKIDRKAYQKIICGTVHALQGAEIDIVIFSTVISPGDSTSFVGNLNMLNVAVSRAKSSFLVFGNLNTLDATKNSPLGRLKKWLQEDEDCELSSKIIFDTKETTNITKRINVLKKHIEALNHVFKIAKKELIIFSPFISSVALEWDTNTNAEEDKKQALNSICEQLKNAVDRGVNISVYTDSTLDMRDNKLKPTAQKGRELIKQSGAILKLINGIHSKTIIIDNDIIIEGSFNWFSAVRDEKSKYHREEASLVVKGEDAKEMIKEAKANLKNMREQNK